MKTKSFFAAANGYSGFRSYFKEVFKPERFNRIFVIKGGPGTGKSTLMKNVADFFRETADLTEKIYCSSDPNSLDGIILTKGTRKVALLDGTAPHETDAKIPGAVDKIINLGEFWDEENLKAHRTEILHLNKEKSSHYRYAYEYLRLAGIFDECILKKVKGAYKNSLKNVLEQICFERKEYRQKFENSTALISSYGKKGLVSLEKKNFEGKTNYTVKGIYGSENLFMQSLKNYLDVNELHYTVYPSPLSESIIEGIYIYECDSFITTVFEYESSIETDSLIDKEILETNAEFLTLCNEEKNRFLTLSKEEFEKASDNHFKLEKIYSSSINFSAHKVLIDDILKDITKVLTD